MNEKITLQDLVELLSEKNGMTKKNADALFRGMFDLIEEALTNEKYVKVKGLGTFKLTEVDSRESMNVNTGERIEIQGHTKVSFTPDTTMKELINKPFSHFETVVLNDGVELEDTPVDDEAKVVEVVDEKVENVIEQSQDTDQPVVEEVMEVPAESIVSPIVEEQIPVEEISQQVEEEQESVVEAPTEEPQIPEITTEEKSIAEDSKTVEPVLEETPMEAPKLEEKVEEKSEIIVPEVSRSESKATFKVLIGIIIVLTIIILFGLYWIFLRQGEVSSTSVISIPVKEETTVVQEEVQPAQKEGTLLVDKDTMIVQPEVVEQTSVLSEDVVYEITGTITTLTLEPGQTLVKLALKYYGSKNFWPYIVEHNPDVIKDADRVPKGATIKIPKLEPKK
ncbi:MAG: HU family DNA-binding protein [Bacteroidaceae bacterium]|nr:HU family DNA-binding protein [Bacteroidaceae bacterium]